MHQVSWARAASLWAQMSKKSTLGVCSRPLESPQENLLASLTVTSRVIKRGASALALSAWMMGCADASAPPAAAPRVGSPCQRDADCPASQRCHATARGQGLCTTTDPEACAAPDVFVQEADALWGSWRGLCAPGCDASCSPSRCVSLASQRLCGPPGGPLEATWPGWQDTLAALGSRCDAVVLGQLPDGRRRWRLSWTPQASSTSALLAPWVAQGALTLHRVSHPGRQTILSQDYRHQSWRALASTEDLEPVGAQGRLTMDWPVMLPYSPQQASVFAPGQPHELEVWSQEPPCLVALERQGLGRSLHLVIHLALEDEAGLSPESAPLDARIHEMIAHARALLARAGVARVEVHFRALDAQQVKRHAVVRELAQLRQLTALGRVEGLAPEQLRAVHVFLVEDLAIAQAPGLLGYSASLPGAVGLAGNADQGVVLAAQDLDQSPRRVGTILAHELGHYLGLRHTTEPLLGSSSPAAQALGEAIGLTDPLPSTPTCPQIARSPRTCPDVDNLMFPVAPPDEASLLRLELTEEQSAVLRAHPAVLP